MEFTGRGFSIFGMFVNWYGVIIAFGMLLGLLVAIKSFKKRGYKVDTVIDLALVAIPSAIVGARLYYVIFYTHDYTFWEIFKIWEGGMAIYGGIIGGFIGVLIYCLVKKINLLEVCDCIAPTLILGQAIGRWGNFTNQEAYGRLITDPNWQFFPFAVNIPSSHFTVEATESVINAFGSVVDNAWFMATFFYESMWNFIVFSVLLLVFYKVGVRGLTLCTYFILYGLGRFVIEGLRLDSLYWGSFRVSQVLSLVLVIAFVIYAGYIIWKEYKNKKLSYKTTASEKVGGGEITQTPQTESQAVGVMEVQIGDEKGGSE